VHLNEAPVVDSVVISATWPLAELLPTAKVAENWRSSLVSEQFSVTVQPDPDETQFTPASIPLGIAIAAAKILAGLSLTGTVVVSSEMLGQLAFDRLCRAK
jgi:hypothetical protein